MAKVIWSPTTLDDIDAIAEYISRDSIEQASLFVTRLSVRIENMTGSMLLQFNAGTKS